MAAARLALALLWVVAVNADGKHGESKTFCLTLSLKRLNGD